MAPVAHWRCKMPRNSHTGMWFMQWLLRLTGDAQCLRGHRFTSGSYSGSYRSLGTQNTANGETYMTLMYNGSRGSLRTQNDRLYRSTSRSCSGSQGSLGTKKIYNCSTYMTFMYNSYNGSCGSLGTQNS